MNTYIIMGIIGTINLWKNVRMIFWEDSLLVNMELFTLNLHTYNIHYLTPKNAGLSSKTRKYNEFAYGVSNFI